MTRNHFALRRVILILSVCFISYITMAQKINLDTLNIDQLNLYKEKATNMRTAGMVLTMIGVPACITGSRLLINFVIKTPVKDWDSPEPNLYAILTVVGAAAGVTGIPLWITGSNRKTAAEIALKAFDMKTENSLAVGLGITIRF